MAKSLNKVQLIGNLTAQPDVKTTPNGALVANFSVATTNEYTDSTGAKVSKPDFHRVVLWKKLAEIAEKYCAKGTKVFIEGSLTTRSYEDKDGIKRSITEIVGNNLILLNPKTGEKETYSETPFGNDEPASAPTKKNKKEDEIHIEDIPF